MIAVLSILAFVSVSQALIVVRLAYEVDALRRMLPSIGVAIADRLAAIARAEIESEAE